MEVSKSFKPHIYLLIVNTFYGLGFSISKLVMPKYIKPFGFIFIRVAVCVLLFFTLKIYFNNERIKKSDFPLLFLCGMFGVTINQLMFFKGLSLTVPINASLIMIMTPILVLVISFLIGREHFSIVKLSGIFLGAAGAFIIFAGKGFHFSSDTLLGDFFILINATSYAIYLIIVKPLMQKYQPITVVSWVFLFGFIPVSLIGFKEFSVIEFSMFPTSIWVATIFIILGTTFFAYLLNMLALQHVNSSVVGAYIYIQPVVAIIVATLIGMDSITLEKGIAGLLIFSGVYLVTFQFTQIKKIIS